MFSTVFSTAVEKWSETAGRAAPDGECSRGAWEPEGPPFCSEHRAKVDIRSLRWQFRIRSGTLAERPTTARDAVDIADGVNYHRQFAVEVWPLTFERPAVPVPLPDFKQP